MRILSTLKGQIVIGVLFVAAYPVFVEITDYSGVGTGTGITIDALNLLLQIAGLCLLFGIIKNGKGSECKVTRMLIAMFLWVVFWIAVLSHTRLVGLEQTYWFDRFLPKVVLYAGYNALVIVMVVLFSYIIGEGMNKIVKEKTLFNRSTLKGQIAICSLLFLPIPVMLMLPEIFQYAFTFLIPVIVFCVLFLQGNSKGSEFKVTRIILATLLWGAFYIGSLIYGYDEMLKWTGLDKLIIKDYGVRDYCLNMGLCTLYNAVGIAMVVLLSYVIGKWIHRRIGNQISKKRE